MMHVSLPWCVNFSSRLKVLFDDGLAYTVRKGGVSVRSSTREGIRRLQFVTVELGKGNVRNALGVCGAYYYS